MILQIQTERQQIHSYLYKFKNISQCKNDSDTITSQLAGEQDSDMRRSEHL